MDGLPPLAFTPDSNGTRTITEIKQHYAITSRIDVRPWVVACVNVLLGIPGVVPLSMAWYLAAAWPLDALGLTQRDPTENDGILPVLVAFGPVIAASVLTWWLVNRWMRQRAVTSAKAFWATGIIASLLPCFILAVASSITWGRRAHGDSTTKGPEPH